MHLSLSLLLSLFTSIYIYKQYGSRSDPNGIQEIMFRQLKHLGMQ